MYLAFSAMAARSDIAPARWRNRFLIWMMALKRAGPSRCSDRIRRVWLAFLVIAYIARSAFGRLGNMDRSDAGLNGATPNIRR